MKEFALKYFIESFKTNPNISTLLYDFSEGLMNGIRNGIKEIRKYYYDTFVKPIIIMSYHNMGELEKEAYGSMASIFLKIPNSDKNGQLESVYGHNIIPINMSDEYMFITNIQSMKDQHNIINLRSNLIIVDSKGDIKNDR